jgi:hypothetical protein
VGLVGLTALLTASLFLAWTKPPHVALATGLAGEHWYRVELAADHVGYMRTHAFNDAQGAWHFDSTTHYGLAGSAPTTLTKHLIFDPMPPFSLVSAHYAQNNTSSVKLVHSAGNYLATVSRQGRERQIEVNWHYTLEDFLAFESWLETTTPQAGNTHPVKNIDFERLSITQRVFRIVGQNPTGYLVETNAPNSATTTQLNQNYQPVELEMAGIFKFSRTDQAGATPATKVATKIHYLFPLSERLVDHKQITDLVLSTVPALPTILDSPFNTRSRPSQEDPAQHLDQSLQWPVGHAKIEALMDTLPTKERTPEQLVKITYELLRYEEGKPAGSVLKALETGYGECTDFADLFTTLARTAGIPARTVYGLAYRDSTSPAMMFHAWNEIFYSGQWLSVDPTWNQASTDATHLKLNDTQSTLLIHALNTAPFKFVVNRKSYQR